MHSDVVLPLKLTKVAAEKIKILIINENNSNLKLRIYIIGGGCNGFRYKFIFDDQVNEGDMIINHQGVALIVDQISLQYLIGGTIDYIEKLEGSRFTVINPNAKNTCNCGFSFNI